MPTYPLSATKLVTYKQCPQAYNFRYEHRLQSPAAFGNAELGNALHQALAVAYRDWHYNYNEHKPSWDWFDRCWNRSCDRLTTAQVIEGRKILRGYYEQFVLPLDVMPKPLGVESRICARIQFENIEFSLGGRYDRLDIMPDGDLELIDYKTNKIPTIPDEIDVQLGLYYLALEQVYQQNLKRLSFIFLRTRERVDFEVTGAHREQVRSLISDLALRLRNDSEWEPCVGGHCDRCGYQKYCGARTEVPEALPETGKGRSRVVQLALGV
jgi:putative RecB family exonuclease